MAQFNRPHISFYSGLYSNRISIYLVSFLRYSTSNNDVPLKSGSTVVHGHLKRHRLIDHVRLPISAIVSVTLSCTIFEIFNVDE